MGQPTVTPQATSNNPQAPQPNQIGTSAAQAVAQHHQQQQLTGPTGTPYPGYNLANVDMSSFQGVDWSSLYGMGMYV